MLSLMTSDSIIPFEILNTLLIPEVSCQAQLIWNIQRLFSLNILLFENVCIFEGTLLGASSFFQDTKMHIISYMLPDIQKKRRSLCIVWKWASPLPCLTAATQPFNKLINLSTSRQCLHISNLSEQIFENFPNSCFISSHLLEQALYDNLLSSKFFEAKAIWRLFMASENPLNWFMSVIFKKACHFSIAFASMR